MLGALQLASPEARAAAVSRLGGGGKGHQRRRHQPRARDWQPSTILTLLLCVRAYRAPRKCLSKLPNSLLSNSGRSSLERRYCDIEAGEADVEQESGSAFLVPSPTKIAQ
jgi:hypothetical protein